jgi:hypothetical protein
MQLYRSLLYLLSLNTGAMIITVCTVTAIEIFTSELVITTVSNLRVKAI